MRNAAARGVSGRWLLLLGLAVTAIPYLWPAFSAPVVLWSDSRIDLEWAGRGEGIFRPAALTGPAGPVAHPAKPAYLLFLKVAGGISPPLNPRSIVITQSLLLWLSIGGTAWFIGHRRGIGTGIVLYLLLILFLRLRDAASAVMPESLAAALLIPIVALFFETPVSIRGLALQGALLGALFWVRPNVAAIALTVGCLKMLLERRARSLGVILLAFVAALLPFGILTSPRGGDPLRGLSHPIFEASADYFWQPTLGSRPLGEEKDRAREELRRAGENWRETLRREGLDAWRQMFWRAFHGLLGTEFYDARWSPAYRRLTFLSRVLSPFLIILAVSVLFVFPFRETMRAWNVAGPFFLALLLLQNLLLGSLPRFVLPFLPALFTLGLFGLFSLTRATPRRKAAAALVAAGLAAFAMTHRGVLDMEWGQVERPGVMLRQRIPRGAFPERAPATLHLRIASPLVPSTAHFVVRGPGSEVLYSSVHDTARDRQAVSIPLPDRLLRVNAQGPIEIEIVSFGRYDAVHYLLFPIVPPPWGSPARRDGSSFLSPATGIPSGSFDWWAHAGAP